MKFKEGHVARRAGREVAIEFEDEAPLEIDLQSVIDRIKKIDPQPPYRSDYELLLSLVGVDFFKQLRPDFAHTAEDQFQSANQVEIKHFKEKSRGLAFSKLLDPKTFSTRGWSGAAMSYGADLWHLMLQRAPNESWLTGIQMLVLFPEQRERILKSVRQGAPGHLAWVKENLRDLSTSMGWVELAAMRLVDPQHTEVGKIARRFWAQWQEKLEELLAVAESPESADSSRRGGSAGAALGLACSMYILAAEKAVINDQGLPEITPAVRKVTPSLPLPGRSLV